MNIRDRVGQITWRLGLTTLAYRAIAAGGRFALNFHGVSQARRPGIPAELQPHHSRQEFEQVLVWLQPRFAFLRLEEFLFSDRPGVLLTFDDGHANNYTNILPILETYRAQGVFFVSTQHVHHPGDWLPASRRDARRGWGSEAGVPAEIATDLFDGLSAAQLAALAASSWAVIGSHTVTHPFLSECSPEQVWQEVAQSRQDLQTLTGQPVDTFAYPYGSYNRAVAEAVSRAGYRAAFAVDPIPVGLPAFEIPRVGIYSSQPSYLGLKVCGLHRRPLRKAGLEWN
ncbi:MAG: polysaccharide deacetylase family protein [Chloroflexota bacterium]